MVKCVEWEGARDKDGYGVFGRPQKRAHRAAWEASRNMEVPEGLLILHSCDNPPCVLPEHLYPGTWKMNMQDRIDRGRNPKLNNTHCPQGHEYDTVNSRGHRECKECVRISNHKQYLKRKEQTNAGS